MAVEMPRSRKGFRVSIECWCQCDQTKMRDKAEAGKGWAAGLPRPRECEGKLPKTEERKGCGLICVITRLRGLLVENVPNGAGVVKGPGRRLLHLLPGQLAAQVETGSCAMDHGGSLGAEG